VDAISNVSCNCGLSGSCVYDTFVSIDWNLDTFFIKCTPVLFYQIGKTGKDVIGHVATDVEVFLEVGVVTFGFEFDLDELRSAVLIC
jgi:hypothetical protein